MGGGFQTGRLACSLDRPWQPQTLGTSLYANTRWLQARFWVCCLFPPAISITTQHLRCNRHPDWERGHAMPSPAHRSLHPRVLRRTVCSLETRGTQPARSIRSMRASADRPTARESWSCASFQQNPGPGSAVMLALGTLLQRPPMPHWAELWVPKDYLRQLPQHSQQAGLI